MAELAERPHPPGDYPVVVVGSGPGGLQMSYFLARRGIRHALLSADSAPAGMFQRFPFFQRLISWTKPYAPAERGTRAYERYDWNSMIGEEPEHRTLLPGLMDGTSYFPSRDEMERGIALFVERTGLQVRYECRWESTRTDNDGFVLSTTDGEYRCRAAVFAMGMTRPWKPDIPGLELVPHYVETRPPKDYTNKKIVIIGKRNSGFEIADNLPLTVGLVVDGSGSMEKGLSFVHEASAELFKNVIREKDRGFVIEFRERPRFLQELTANKVDLQRAARETRAEGATALYDSIVLGLYQFRALEGRKALVVVTDGADNRSHVEFPTLLRYARSAGAPVYFIAVGIPLTDFKSRKAIGEIATESGGQVFSISSASIFLSSSTIAAAPS